MRHEIGFSGKFLPRNIRKHIFFGCKMGGRLIHTIDLYTGKYGISTMSYVTI